MLCYILALNVSNNDVYLSENSMLGSLIFSRKFIPVFSRIAYPLYQLLHKDKEFKWDENCEVAFKKLKESLLSDVVLAHPNYN